MKVALFQTPLMRPERSPRDSFRWCVNECIESEQAGLSEVFIGEHATQAWESVPNPELVIAAAALETERIVMGPLAHLLPYHNPASLAIQTAYLNRILEERYILGVGAGAYPTDGALRGLTDLSGNHAMLMEGLEIIERVWKREPFMFKGEHFSAGWPEPEPDHPLSDYSPKRDTIPIAVTGLSANSPSMAFAGARGWIPCSVYSGIEVLKKHWTTYETAATDNGIVPDRSLHHIVRDVFVGETDAEARRWAIEGGMGVAWREYLLPIYKRFHMIDALLEDAGATEADIDDDFLLDHVWLVGSPETVAEKINANFEQTGGWGTLMVQAHDYLDTPEPWHQSLRLLAEEVAPKINPLPAPTPA